MVYKEEVRDLFTVPQGYMLAHCISADFNLGGGIAKQFCEHYDMRNRLLADYSSDFDGVGLALEIDNVYNLITKRYVHNSPTYENLAAALEDMKDSMIYHGQKKLAMPRIGCGLDGLDWKIVRSIIKDIFEDTKIEILICMREEDFIEDVDSTDYEDFPMDDIEEDDDIDECTCDCGECNDCHEENIVLGKSWTDEELESVYTAILEELKKRHENT